MSSLITHALVGLAAGKTFSLKDLPKRFWFFSIACPLIPDIDSIGLFLGIPYSDFWGHRGIFHSIPFALLLALFVVMIFFRDEKPLTRRWYYLITYFFLLTSTHGILDAFTSGGLGIALFSPFENSRYFFPWTPIQVSPIGFKAFFGEWGLRVLISEFIWVWMPTMFVMFAVFLVKRKRTS